MVPPKRSRETDAVIFVCYTSGFVLPFSTEQNRTVFLASVSKKRSAATRRPKASSPRKGAAAAKATSRVSSRRASATKRPGATARKPTAAEIEAAELASQAKAASLGLAARLFKEVGGIICLFAALIALLALISFDANDPGWSQTGSGSIIQNSVGRAGAWFADVTLYLFGFMAYLIPFVIGVSGWMMFRGHRQSTTAYRPFVFVRIIGVAMMLVSASGLADLHFHVAEGALPQGTFGGGILGTAVAWRLVPYLQHLGTTLVLLALFFSSLTLAFGTSWIQLIEWIGGTVVRLIDGIRRRGREVLDAHDEHSRMLAADREREVHLRAQELEAQSSSSTRKSRGDGVTKRKRKTDTEPDPLLNSDDTAGSGAALTTGVGAALAMAREKARASQELAGKAAGSVAATVGTVATAGRVDKFDVLGDSLGEADALLSDEFDETVRIDRAAAQALKSINPSSDAAESAGLTGQGFGDAGAGTDADGEAPAHAVILPTVDPAARKKKIAINVRPVEQKQTKLFLDVPDS
ncbi:DNA translocase FtsK 4TM domain-containing protein, partial [bacterium]|nr:DNA translocase FtsK 4TM domain-containing protein [bacterium]